MAKSKLSELVAYQNWSHIRIGRTIALTSPKIAAAINAVMKLLNSKPGTT
jgi:hypothetical protein